MKKMTFILATLFTLAACSKPADQLPDPTVAKENFFSKVTRWKDGRTPSVDTVWTLRLFSQNMVDSFARYNGYVYFESTTYKEQGVLWFK